jgi:hypothetical protein
MPFVLRRFKKRLHYYPSTDVLKSRWQDQSYILPKNTTSLMQLMDCITGVCKACYCGWLPACVLKSELQVPEFLKISKPKAYIQCCFKCGEKLVQLQLKMAGRSVLEKIRSLMMTWS